MVKYSKEFIEELRTASEIRGAIYSYLYKIFKAPVEKSFLGLTEKFIPSFKELANIINNDNTNKAIEILEKYNSEEKNGQDTEKFLNDLNIQYTGLFLLGNNSVPTSASVFLSPDALLKREPWENVCKIYAKRGFKIPDDFKEPEDHIAMETLYMEKLNGLVITLIQDDMVDKIEAVLKEQKTFIDEQMRPWVKTFASLVAKKSENKPLYFSAAILLDEFLQYDSELTQELIEAE